MEETVYLITVYTFFKFFHFSFNPANTANHGGQMYPFKCDMSDTNNVLEMFKWIENHSELGRVDVCICNAGLVASKKLSEIR